MKQKLLLLPAIAFLLIYGCSKSSKKDNKPVVPDTYLPVTKGSLWVYKDSLYYPYVGGPATFDTATITMTGARARFNDNEAAYYTANYSGIAHWGDQPCYFYIYKGSY